MDKSKARPVLCDDNTCTGCMACVNACNKGALSMGTNKEGFYRPHLNSELCVNCGLCIKSCPVLNPPIRHEVDKITVYSAWNLNEHIRLNSSSGGAFTALAEVVLSMGGLVVGAAYTKDMCIEHIVVDNVADLPKLRLSKYAQSRIGNILAKIRDELKTGRKVLFVGTPCQASGLKSFLKGSYDNLICVDLICHGVPSISFLHTYLKWLEPKTGKIVNLNFRDKQKGWYDNLRVVGNSEGKSIALKGCNDAYWVAFNRNNCLQESCYHCTSQGFPRCSDITLADFWGIGRETPYGHKDEIEKGISAIIVNNPSVQPIIDRLNTKLYIEERSLKESIFGNKAGIRSSKRPLARDTFYSDLNNMSFDEFRLLYMKPSFKELLIKVFRERLPFSLIKYIRLKKQK